MVRARRGGRILLLVGLVAAMTTLAACGGGSSDSEGTTAAAETPSEETTPAETAASDEAADTGAAAGGDVAALLEQAKADVERATAPVTSFDQYSPGPAPTPPSGIKTGNLTCLWSVPACKRIADGIDEAMKTIGWEPITVDGTADQRNQVTAMQSFLTAGVAAVALAAIDPHGISDLLKEAVTAEIPFVMAAGLDPRPFGGFGPSVDVPGGLYQAGQDLGAWVANDSQGEASVLIMSSTDNPALQERDKGFIDYLHQFPGITFVNETDANTIYVPFSDVGPPLQSQVKALLQANPPGTIDYIYTPFDGFTTFVVQAAQDLGRDDVKALGFDASPQNIDFIRNGQVQAATQATAWGWCAWETVDELNRALAGEDPYEGGCPSQVIDATNVPPEGQLWDGDIDYKTEFKALWGVQ